MEQQEIKQLMDEQKTLVGQLRERFDKESAEVKTFGGLMTETKAVITKMEARLDEIETKLSRPTFKVEGTDAKKEAEKSIATKAFEKFVRWGSKGNAAIDRMSDEEKASYRDMQTKALSETTDTQGGLLVTEDFRLEVIKRLANITGVGAYATRQPTSRDVLRYPKVAYSADDIKNSGIQLTWEDETPTVTETDFSLASVAIPVKKVRALIKVSRDLLEDSAVDVLALLQNLIATAFAVEEDNVFTVGAGGTKPEGFMTEPGITAVNSGSSGAFTADGIFNLVYNLPAQYTPNARFMAKRLSLGAIRLLKDGNGRYLWQPAVAAGQPDTLAGYPFNTNEWMPAVAAAAKAMILADFKLLYVVADRVGMTMQRLDEKYADTDQVGFIVRRRVGGKVAAPWAARVQSLQ